MRVFNRYIIKNLLLATAFITVILSAVIMLTQSLRFLELIIDSGASSGTFWTLTFMALPRFWEIIIPIAIMIATTFVYSRLKESSELVVMRSTGSSPLQIIKPALLTCGCFVMFLWTLTLWITPQSLSGLQALRQIVKSQFSLQLLHEGVFNQFGQNITVFINEKMPDGTLSGVIIHDQTEKPAVTTMAQKGIISDQNGNYKITVYNGSRQSFNEKKDALQRLDFERYTVDLPLSTTVKQRWKEPDERTLHDLLNPNMSLLRDREHISKFIVEIHRRISAPLLAIAYTLIGASMFVLGPTSRTPSYRKAATTILITILLQGLYLAILNIAKQHFIAVTGLYAVPLIPIILCLYLISPIGEKKRRDILYKAEVSS